MSGNIQEQAESIIMRAEVHDNWYVLRGREDGAEIAVGVYLPPPWAEVLVENVEADTVADLAAGLIAQTIGPDAAGFHSARVASNNRLLMVGRWTPGSDIAGIQFDRLMPDQARELLGELVERSKGPSLVGTIEFKG